MAMFLFLLPSFFIWNITGDTLTYHQQDQCATITGQATADDKEKEQHLTADQLKAKMHPQKTEAPASDIKQTASEIWADGNVHFTTKEFDVTADEAYFHPTSHIVELKGNVRIVNKQNIAVGDRAEINLNTQTYTLHKASGQIKDEKNLTKQKSKAAD